MSERVEFGSREAANRARDRYDEYLCPIDDDRRFKTVAFVSDTPESLLQQIEAEASEDRAVGNQRSNTVELTDRERDKIGDLDGFDRTTTTMSWASAKGVFEREGLGDQFRDAIGYLTDYDDPAEGAEQYVREYQEGGSGGGSRDVGEEDITGRQREARAAAREQEEGCDHAHDVCRHGDPQACEFLTDACGFDEDEVDEILGAEDDAGDAPPDEIEGKAAGALSRSWGGYRGAIAELGDALDRVEEAWENATDAADAINGIRARHGQDEMHFDALEVANADLLDLVRHAAADCEECHADHSDHDHAVTEDDRETLGEFVESGAASTPVGTSENTDDAIADRAPNRTVPPEPAEQPTNPLNEVPAFDAPASERLGAVAVADATADGDTPDGSDEQFASEQQGTLGVDVEAEQTAEEKQVTLGGADATESNRALPGTWRREGSAWVAGPYRIQIDSSGSKWAVRLYGPDHRFNVATGVRSADQAEQIAQGFAGRVAPDDVSFHSNDSTVPEAAASAKADAAPDSGGLTEYA
ncbi:MAG: hypothetical protein HQRvContig05_8 [Haloquadratum phage sp.]|nr:MAG: hypothetical protein HQRvContig05_8 [Haloquadratum phage sp.]